MLYQCSCRQVQIWTERTALPQLVCRKCGQAPAPVTYVPRDAREPAIERVLVDMGVEVIECGGCAPPVGAK